MQKKAAHIILDAEFTTTCTLTVFNELNCIPFFIKRHNYINRCSIPYERLESITQHIYIISTLKANSEIRNRSSCFSNLIFINCPVFKKNTEGGQTFSMRMIRNWNKLSADIKEVKNV